MGGGDVSAHAREEHTSLTLRLDERQITREAALRTAYWFTKDLYVEFPPSEATDSVFEVVLKLKATVPTLENPNPKKLADLAADFQSALIDSELRIQIQKETSSIRELLLAKAFAEAGVLEDGPPGSFFDPAASSEPEKPSDLVRIVPNDPTFGKP